MRCSTLFEPLYQPRFLKSCKISLLLMCCHKAGAVTIQAVAAPMLLFGPALAHINPGRIAGIFLQFLDGQLDCAIAAAAGGENSFKPL